MKRKTFLTITAVVAFLIGCFALSSPGVLITSVKHAPPSDTANVMARTVGILLITIGVLDFLVRDHEDSPTMRSVLIANLVLQLGIMPIDPSAYASGVYRTLGSFAPNTLLHIFLASGFIYYLVKMKNTVPIRATGHIDNPLAEPVRRGGPAIEERRTTRVRRSSRWSGKTHGPCRALSRQPTKCHSCRRLLLAPDR